MQSYSDLNIFSSRNLNRLSMKSHQHPRDAFNRRTKKHSYLTALNYSRLNHDYSNVLLFALKVIKKFSFQDGLLFPNLS